jgi:hypothetical protein
MCAVRERSEAPATALLLFGGRGLSVLFPVTIVRVLYAYTTRTSYKLQQPVVVVFFLTAVALQLPIMYPIKL